MSMASRPHSSSRDLVENILDAGLPPDEVALEVSCEEIVSLAQDYRDLEEQLERMKHRIECADTPLMRDVLAERDGLKEQVESMQRAGKIVNAENDRLLTEGRRIQEQLEAARRDVAEWEERSHRFEHRTYDAEEQFEALRAAAEVVAGSPFGAEVRGLPELRVLLASNPAERR